MGGCGWGGWALYVQRYSTAGALWQRSRQERLAGLAACGRLEDAAFAGICCWRLGAQSTVRWGWAGGGGAEPRRRESEGVELEGHAISACDGAGACAALRVTCATRLCRHVQRYELITCPQSCSPGRGMMHVHESMVMVTTRCGRRTEDRTINKVKTPNGNTHKYTTINV